MWPPLYVIDPRSPKSWRLYCHQHQRVQTYEGMGLKQELMQQIYGYRMRRPPCELKSGIVPLVHGEDLIMSSRCVVGTHMCWVLGVLQRIDAELNACQGLIIVPSREHARNLELIVHGFGSYMNVRSGEVTRSPYVDNDGNIPHVVVSTLGRALDAIRKKYLSTTHLRIVIYDQLDEFGDALSDMARRLRKVLPARVQVGVFLYGEKPEHLDLARSLIRDPVLTHRPYDP